MASGIDTSARFISLALNIAVMGFILVEGIASFLRRQLPPAIDAAQLRSLAEQLTTGTAPTIGQGAAAWTVPAETARQALAHGFGWVMLYGGVSVWLFALGSLLVFGAPRARAGPERVQRAMKKPRALAGGAFQASAADQFLARRCQVSTTVSGFSDMDRMPSSFSHWAKSG